MGYTQRRWRARDAAASAGEFGSRRMNTRADTKAGRISGGGERPPTRQSRDARRRRRSVADVDELGVALICAVGPCQVSWVEVEGCPGGRAIPDQLVVIERRQRVLVTRRAVRRAERVALDRRGAGAIGVGVRAGAHAYLGPRPSGWLRVGDMMVMGFPLGEGQSGRSVFGGRPRERGGSAMPGAGRGASA